MHSIRRTKKRDAAGRSFVIRRSGGQVEDDGMVGEKHNTTCRMRKGRTLEERRGRRLGHEKGDCSRRHKVLHKEDRWKKNRQNT